MHAFRHHLGSVLLRIHGYMSGQGNHALLADDADLRAINTWLPFKFIQHVTLQMCISFHDLNLLPPSKMSNNLIASAP